MRVSYDSHVVLTSRCPDRRLASIFFFAFVTLNLLGIDNALFDKELKQISLQPKHDVQNGRHTFFRGFLGENLCLICLAFAFVC